MRFAPVRSELEARRRDEVQQSRRHGVPGRRGRPGGLAGAGHEGGVHRGLVAHDADQAAAHLELGQQDLGHLGHRAAEHDHVEGAIGRSALGAIGGFVPIIRSGDFDVTKPAIRNGLLMTVVCVVFVVLCVKSFIEARKARQAGMVA